MNDYEVNKIATEIDKYVQGANSTVEKGNLFCKWALKYIFEQSEDEIEDMYAVGGKSDNSIDAYFEEDKTLKIIQTMYNKSHNWSQITKFLADVKRILRNPDNYVGDNVFLPDVTEKIEQYYSNDSYIEIYYITNAIFTNEEKEKIEEEKKLFELEFEKHFDKVTLNILDLEGIKDYIDMALDVIPKKYKSKSASIILKNYFISNITCVAEIELTDFASFVKNNKEYLFYSNIRNYLKTTPVNKGIIETFKNKPTDFWYFNNGITVVCDDFELKEHGRLKSLHISMPQIVNGCQTANTIIKEYVALSSDERKKLQGSILVKVIKDKNKNKKDEITEYTNRQNAVSGKDFFALNKFQKKMVRKFEEIGYFYEIQNKASLAKKASEMKKYKGLGHLKYLFPTKFNNVLPVKTVVQTFAAGMHFLPGTAASRAGELMVYGKKWSMIFNETTSEEALYWLYPFAIMNYAKYQLDYANKNNTTFKRHSLMFFIACYFRTIIHMLKEIGIVGEIENINPLYVPVDYYSKIFEESNFNKEILEFVDEVIKRFMKDRSIRDIMKKKYGDLDISNFMKSEVETNEKIRQIVDEFIIEELRDNIDLIGKSKNLFYMEL